MKSVECSFALLKWVWTAYKVRYHSASFIDQEMVLRKVKFLFWYSPGLVAQPERVHRIQVFLGKVLSDLDLWKLAESLLCYIPISTTFQPSTPSLSAREFLPSCICKTYIWGTPKLLQMRWQKKFSLAAHELSHEALPLFVVKVLFIYMPFMNIHLNLLSPLRLIRALYIPRNLPCCVGNLMSWPVIY